MVLNDMEHYGLIYCEILEGVDIPEKLFSHFFIFIRMIHVNGNKRFIKTAIFL